MYSLLKRCSLVYSLQVFAVILLFAYKDAAPTKESVVSAVNKDLPVTVSSSFFENAKADSLVQINMGTR